ncbi:hypothetical protein BGW36DRAFT_257434, partial [Talaromyces proteolyticus]
FGLSANTKKFEYQDKRHFYSIQLEVYKQFAADSSRSSSQYIIFSKVNQDVLQDLIDDDDLTEVDDLTEIDDFTFPIESYFPVLETIVIKMTTEAHYNAQENFNRVLIAKLHEMNGLDKKITFVRKVETEKRTKEPDKAYRPITLPTNRTRQWPTLTLEIGYSEPRWKLAKDAHWWLTESIGAVKTVVTAKIEQKRRSIEFEKWVMEDDNDHIIPKMTYHSVLSKETDEKPIQITNSDPLVVDFQQLFLRPAAANIEKDIIFSKDDLEEIATAVWASQ